jgi:hypothetical protein
MPTEGEGSSNAEGADMRKTDIERVLRQEPTAVFAMAHDYWRPGHPGHLIGLVIDRLETTEYKNYSGVTTRKTRAIGTQVSFRTETTAGGYLRYSIEEIAVDHDIRDIGWERCIRLSDSKWRPQTKYEWTVEMMAELDAECRKQNEDVNEMLGLIERWHKAGITDPGAEYWGFAEMQPHWKRLLIRLTDALDSAQLDKRCTVWDNGVGASHEQKGK